MLRHRRSVISLALDEFAAAQAFQRSLDRAFGKAGRFRQHAQAGRNRFPFSACGLSQQIKVNKIRGRLMIVANQIPHQDIKHVFVNRNRFVKPSHDLYCANGVAT